MNDAKHWLNTLAWSAILLGASMSLTQVAHAKKAVSAPVQAPQIDNAYVSPLNQFTPGTDLTFTLEGTPNGRASVRVGGIRRVINLQESEKGLYSADYTISSNDRITAGSVLRATLSVRGRSTGFTAPLGNSSAAAAPVAPAPVAVAPAAVRPALNVQQFTVTPVEAIDPGADLKFMVTGTPAAKATFSIEGIVKSVAMQETKPGQYEGSYTIRRLDHFPSNLNITANLEADGKTVSRRLTQALVVDAKPPVIKNLAPRENEAVTANPVLVSATFDDAGGVGIDTKSVRILLSGMDVTASSTITAQFFSYRVDLRPGTYQVDVSGKDLRGTPVTRRWVFTVLQANPVAAVLPLQILSPANNSQVGGGAVEVRGRTAPDAKVDVEVQAIAQIAGFFGLNQRIFSQSLRADANGNFSFSYQPPVPIPGARYEIAIKSSKDDLTKDFKLVLFQQK